MTNQIKYPRITFWNQKAEQIDFINPGDFRREKLLNALGLNRSRLEKSFGVVERKEIMRRQRLIRFFVEHPRLIKFFYKANFDNISLPEDGQVFLNYFSPEKKHNPFWKLVNDLIKEVGKCSKVPPEIFFLISFLGETKDELEAKERIMADNIAKKVQKATHMEGAVQFFMTRSDSLKLQEDETEVYGYKKYSYGLSKKWKEHHPPEWTSEGVGKWIGFGLLSKAYCKIRNWIISRVFYTPLIIESLPESIKTEIESFIKNKLSNGLPEIKSGEKVTIQVFFRYSGNGLEIQLLNVFAKKEEKAKKIEFIKKDFRGYGRHRLSKIRKNNKKFAREVKYIHNRLRSTDFIKAISEKIPRFCQEWIQINSWRADQEFKWYAVKALYATDFKDTYEKLQDYRYYFRCHMNMLEAIQEIAKTLVQKSKEWKKPLCFPEILEDDQHLVSFETLEAIHLIGEKKTDDKEALTAKDLISINSLPSLNGQMIGFTGQNAGGKSTTEETIVNDIFLAQSGLPIFGKGFALNAKRRIGMVFLERGVGSTAELLLLKIKALLISLKDTDENGTVLILDEVGQGTQEIGGLDYGKKVLRKLSSNQCSIIFSTQITELAEYAKEELHAECFDFDLNHQIQPGIGSGRIERLMDRIGITELLEVKS